MRGRLTAISLPEPREATERMNVPRRRLAAAISLVIVLGFAIVPLAIRLGFIQLGE